MFVTLFVLKGTFEWVDNSGIFWIDERDDGEKALLYDNWDRVESISTTEDWVAEPNNIGSERCVVMSSLTEVWRNVDCAIAHTFVCEYRTFM